MKKLNEINNASGVLDFPRSRVKYRSTLAEMMQAGKAGKMHVFPVKEEKSIEIIEENEAGKIGNFGFSPVISPLRLAACKAGKTGKIPIGFSPFPRLPRRSHLARELM